MKSAGNTMIGISRRRLLQMAAAGAAATNGRMAMGAPSPSLGAIAAENVYLFGAAAAEVIDTDAAYRDLYVTQTRIITTDVALKIGRIAPQPGPKHFEPPTTFLHSATATRSPCAGTVSSGTNGTRIG